MNKLNRFVRFCSGQAKFIFLVFIAIISIWGTLQRTSFDRWRYTIFMDGRGYYSYLPAIFIYNDPSCSFYSEVSVAPPDSANFINSINGKPVNKYYCGVALLQVPFFAGAHLVANVFDFEPTGYSKPYQYGVAFAGIFYFLAGLFFLWKLLEKFHFRKRVILIVSVSFAIGTNLFHYAVYEPSMSHIYSFATITAFLFYTKSFFVFPDKRSLILSGIFLALVALLRPVNLAVVLAFPVMAGNMENLKTAFKWISKNAVILFITLGLFSAICSIQLIIYYWETGQFFVWSYKGEGFDFMRPHLYGTLFSFEKGLFIYTPLTFFSLFGLFVVFRRSRFTFFALLFLFAIIILIVSSWYDWRYGFSFGARAYVEYYSLFALCFAFLMDAAFRRKIMLSIMILISLFIIVFYGIQQYQFEHHIIHPIKMNKDRYCMVFLHTERKYEDTLYKINTIMESEGNFNDMEGFVEWPGVETIRRGPAYSGHYSCRIDSAFKYSVGFCENMSSKEIYQTPYHAKVSAWVMRNNPIDSAVIVFLQSENENVFFNHNFPLPKYKKAGAWEYVSFEVSLPERKVKDEYFRISFFNSKGVVYIDDLKIELSKMP